MQSSYQASPEQIERIKQSFEKAVQFFKKKPSADDVPDHSFFDFYLKIKKNSIYFGTDEESIKGLFESYNNSAMEFFKCNSVYDLPVKRDRFIEMVVAQYPFFLFGQSEKKLKAEKSIKIIKNPDELIKIYKEIHHRGVAQTKNYAVEFEDKKTGFCELLGGRKTQEDTVFVGGFRMESNSFTDPEWINVATESVKAVQVKLVAEFGKEEVRGSCLMSNIITQSKIITTNVGDSTTHLVHIDGNGTASIIRLNNLHNPTEPAEKKRLKDAKKLQYIMPNGYLSDSTQTIGVSRAMGDASSSLKECGVIHDPEITITPIPVGGISFLITACDGLTEKNKKNIRNNTFIDENKIRDLVVKNKHESPVEIAKILASCAFKDALSGDNISVVVTHLTEHSKNFNSPLHVAVFDGHGGWLVSHYLHDHYSSELEKNIEHNIQFNSIIKPLIEAGSATNSLTSKNSPLTLGDKKQLALKELGDILHARHNPDDKTFTLLFLQNLKKHIKVCSVKGGSLQYLIEKKDAKGNGTGIFSAEKTTSLKRMLNVVDAVITEVAVRTILDQTDKIYLTQSTEYEKGQNALNLMHTFFLDKNIENKHQIANLMLYTVTQKTGPQSTHAQSRPNYPTSFVQLRNRLLDWIIKGKDISKFNASYYEHTKTVDEIMNDFTEITSDQTRASNAQNLLGNSLFPNSSNQSAVDDSVDDSQDDSKKSFKEPNKQRS